MGGSPMKKSEWAKRLRTCHLDHGGTYNGATVYGHTYPWRECIRIKGTDVWVYSTEPEKE